MNKSFENNNLNIWSWFHNNFTFLNTDKSTFMILICNDINNTVCTKYLTKNSLTFSKPFPDLKQKTVEFLNQ